MHKNLLWKKGSVLIIILLFIGMSITSSSGINLVKQSTKAILDGNILYVGGSGPGNYTKIQDAIDNASDGDTVFVFDDSSPYFENLIVDKSINLLGENKLTTVIDGERNKDVVNVIADLVDINGFTIQNSSTYPDNLGAGISINSNNCIITNNILSNNSRKGLEIQGADNCYISGNIISYNMHGISISESCNIIVEDNVIQQNQFSGIGIYYNHGIVKVLNNNITGNNEGLFIHNIFDIVKITGNLISENDIGIFNNAGSQRLKDFCTISENVISSNSEYGIYIHESNRNHIYKNNFIDNGVNAYIEFYSLKLIGFNKWNFLLKGNYWDDWTGSGSKIIQGKIYFSLGPIENLSIPWFNIDWRPAKEPYDI